MTKRYSEVLNLTIVAKHAGKCAFCGGFVGRGDRVDYEGGMVYHMSCSTVDSAEQLEHEGHRYTITKSHDRHGSYTVELVVFNLAGQHLIKGDSTLIVDHTAKYRTSEKQDGLNAVDAAEVFDNCLAYVRANWPKVN